MQIMYKLCMEFFRFIPSLLLCLLLNFQIYIIELFSVFGLMQYLKCKINFTVDDLSAHSNVNITY